MKTLYRPIGIREFELIEKSGFKRFPPRLAWQPIFYPVLNQAYAEQIALEWNTQDEFSGYCGIVTRFNVTEAIFSNYAIENVGDEIHNELWIPAEELSMFNENIIGKIEVIKVFCGDKFIRSESSSINKYMI